MVVEVSRYFRVAAPIATLVALVALGSSGARAQINPGKLQGTLLDESGAPFGEVTLLFSPAENSPVAARKVKVNKKGQFTYGFFPSGIYKVELVDVQDRYLKGMVYSLLDDGGMEIDHQEIPSAHPTQGLPSFSVRPNRTVVLKLTVAPREAQQQLAMDVAVSEASGALKEMSDLYAAGDYAAVAAKSEALLADKPDLGPALYLRGVALWKLERLDESHAALERALELVPDQPGIFGVMGSVSADYADELAASGKVEEAKALYVEAAGHFKHNLELNPDSLASLYSRASALDKAGMEAELEPALLEIVEADPSYLQAYFRLSNLYLKADRPDDALAVLARIPSGDKSAAVAVYNVAVKLYNEKDLAAAELAAKKAIEIDPQLASVRRLLARVYLQQGNDAAAIPEIEKFIELAPDDPEVGDERILLETLKKKTAS
jgi:tetratricopeptide (TPR) repeat protein